MACWSFTIDLEIVVQMTPGLFPRPQAAKIDPVKHSQRLLSGLC
jgi:hypothetical protein